MDLVNISWVRVSLGASLLRILENASNFVLEELIIITV